MKINGIYIGVLLAGFCLQANEVYSAQVSRKQLEQVEEQAHLREMEHKKKQAEAIALSLELAKLNKAMIKAAGKLQDDEEKTTNMEEKLELLEKQLKTEEEKFSKEHKNLAQTLAVLQNFALYPTETLVTQPLSPVEIIQSAILMRESVPFIKDNADKIQKDLKSLNEKKEKVQNALKKLEQQKKSLLNQQQKIKKMAEEKSIIRKKVEGESLKLKEQAEALASQAEDLKDLVEKLEKDEELSKRRKAELKRAAKRREKEALKKLEEEQLRRIREGKSKGISSEDGKVYQDDDNTLVELSPLKTNIAQTNFANAKGRLTRPAKGEIITGYGQELSKGVNSKGIVIKTRESAQIIAPYDGSVIFSGPFKGYGNLIIIDHGEGYVSLLAGMSLTDVQTGQMVLAGEPVGFMPDTDMAKLYMEIRKDQNPINPTPWLGK